MTKSRQLEKFKYCFYKLFFEFIYLYNSYITKKIKAGRSLLLFQQLRIILSLQKSLLQLLFYWLERSKSRSLSQKN